MELKAALLELIGECSADTYPLQKKKHSLEYLRSIAHLRPRTNTIGAVTRVRSALAFATHQFFRDAGFQYIHTPILSAADCEGAGEMFQVHFDLSLSLLMRRRRHSSCWDAHLSVICQHKQATMQWLSSTPLASPLSVQKHCLHDPACLDVPVPACLNVPVPACLGVPVPACLDVPVPACLGVPVPACLGVQRCEPQWQDSVTPLIHHVGLSVLRILQAGACSHAAMQIGYLTAANPHNACPCCYLCPREKT